ncbi:MAG: hypothetical protein GY935_18245 [Gammaproteobacteria bacterium]|nr:hypothetical protein [Gammaproteobacteria bacterium]
MSGFIEGENRYQSTLFPERVDDYVEEDSTAVDIDNHLIVAHEVTNAGSDRGQLTKMAKQAKAAIQIDTLNVLADRGYYNGDELQSCEQNNIAAYVPNSATSHNKAKGQFDRSEFHYIEKDDEYVCPAGECLSYRFTREEKGKMIRRYWSSACPSCPIHTVHDWEESACESLGA